MQAEIVESTQHAVTPGECKDQFYPGKENSTLQCFPSIQDNRYIVALPSLTSGSTSTVLFNPDQGLSDIVLTLTLPAQSSTLYTNWALPKGWGQAMIRQVGLRIGGSSLYYFTGDQMLVDTLTDCETDGKKQAVFDLAGAPILTSAGFTGTALTAYVYLKMPFNTISALQKSIPLNSDLLTQPIQLQIEFNPFSSVFFADNSGTAGLLTDLPTAFASASVSFRQTHLQDTGHLLSRRENMNEHALTIPLRYFTNTAFRTTVTGQVSGGVPQPVQLNLTGVRAGSMKYMDIWAVKVSDVVGGNPWNWVPLSAVQVTVNGLVYYQSSVYSSQMWNLCDRKTPAQVSSVVLTQTGGNLATATASTVPWTVIPFSQLSEPMAYCNDLTLGLPVMNSIINLSVTLPTTDSYIVTSSYHYAASLLASRGTCDYQF